MSYEIKLCLYNKKSGILKPQPVSLLSLNRNYPLEFREFVNELIKFLQKEQEESAEQLELFAPWEV